MTDVQNDLSERKRSVYEVETYGEKMYRKTISNPFVPFGIVATVCALAGGVGAMIRGDLKRSNTFMKYRVGAQGFTICAVLAGTFILAKTSSAK